MNLVEQPQLSDYADDDLIPAEAMPSLFPGTNYGTWNSLRFKGNGPVFVKVARKVFYRKSDVEVWIGANRKVRTDQHADR